MRPRVVVVGGGLTGLATAWRLRDDAEVTVLEAGDRPGGQVHTIEFGGGPMDVGADAFLARQPEGAQLARDAGLGEDLVAPAARQVLLWLRSGLRPLPSDTVFGVPADVRSLARARVLSPAGSVRAALEPLLPRRFVPGDRSVADLVGERFGREVVDVLVEPLLGGVYAGSADDLSAEATLPPVWAAARTHRSLAAGLAAHRQPTTPQDAPVFLTIRGGLGRLIDRLASDLGNRLRTSTPVDELRHDGTTWTLTAGGERVVADHVVIAVPAGPAAALLAPVVPDAARELAGVRAASVAVIVLGYDPADVRDVPRASGVLVPRRTGRLVKAITLSSNKWPHLADRERFLVRASVGRIDDARPLDLDDLTLIERVDAEVRRALGVRAPARDRHVVRWEASLPQYAVGHRQRVDRLRRALADGAPPGLHVGGAALDGVGLAARAREADRISERIRAAAAATPDPPTEPARPSRPDAAGADRGHSRRRGRSQG